MQSVCGLPADSELSLTFLSETSSTHPSNQGEPVSEAKVTANQPRTDDETEYLRSPAFLGVLFLAVFSYMSCAAYFFTAAPKEFHWFIITLVSEVALIQPTLGIMWSSFCLRLDIHQMQE